MVAAKVAKAKTDLAAGASEAKEAFDVSAKVK